MSTFLEILVLPQTKILPLSSTAALNVDPTLKALTFLSPSGRGSISKPGAIFAYVVSTYDKSKGLNSGPIKTNKNIPTKIKKAVIATLFERNTLSMVLKGV